MPAPGDGVIAKYGNVSQIDTLFTYGRYQDGGVGIWTTTIMTGISAITGTCLERLANGAERLPIVISLSRR
jgi:hypothetical protein